MCHCYKWGKGKKNGMACGAYKIVRKTDVNEISECIVQI